MCCEFEDDSVPDALIEPDIAEMYVQRSLPHQSATVLKGVLLALL